MEHNIVEYVQGIFSEAAKGLIVIMNTLFKGKVGEVVKISKRLMTSSSTQNFCVYLHISRLGSK
jgi:hypothetical protein